jgi:aspartate aminotransferase-like enzyme/GNAT superfamily N-acetyltransferase
MGASLIYKLASTAEEFEAIHHLNYLSFVEEISQHATNPYKRLVDQFHDENTYAICLEGSKLVGMVAGRSKRPFSLDKKLDHLDAQLPPHTKVVEVRLLAVVPSHRKQAVFSRLAGLLARHFRNEGCDLAIISGTVRQLALYQHLGFEPFGRTVGSGDAVYQPMYMTLARFKSNARALLVRGGSQAISLLPGPVDLELCVVNAFHTSALYHRSAQFVEMMARVRHNLCAMTHASHVVVMSGSGTLANDAIAAQLSVRKMPGVVLSNGEFGERLIDHAKRWGLDFQTVTAPWGHALDLAALEQQLKQGHIAWVWAVACETSTGTDNRVEALKQLCRVYGVDLCLDAVSAIGLHALDLRGVRFASAVSGKALGAYCGLAMVFHDCTLVSEGRLPRYLDLAAYEACMGVPFTQSSNLLAALDAALSQTNWLERWEKIQAADAALCASLAEDGLQIVGVPLRVPGIVTLAIPHAVNSSVLLKSMAHHGYLLGGHSHYLLKRNWVQICLMGKLHNDLLEILPKKLAKQFAFFRGAEV